MWSVSSVGCLVSLKPAKCIFYLNTEFANEKKPRKCTLLHIHQDLVLLPLENHKEQKDS